MATESGKKAEIGDPPEDLRLSLSKTKTKREEFEPKLTRSDEKDLVRLKEKEERAGQIRLLKNCQSITDDKLRAVQNLRSTLESTRLEISTFTSEFGLKLGEMMENFNGIFEENQRMRNEIQEIKARKADEKKRLKQFAANGGRRRGGSMSQGIPALAKQKPQKQ